MDNQKPSGQDKRKFKRVEASFSVVYTVEAPYELRMRIGRDVEGIANDLSQGGLSLMTNHQIPAGALLQIKFRLLNNSAISEADRSRKFQLQGEARHNSFSKENGYRVGIRFLNVSEADRDFVANYVRSIR